MIPASPPPDPARAFDRLERASMLPSPAERRRMAEFLVRVATELTAVVPHVHVRLEQGHTPPLTLIHITRQLYPWGSDANEDAVKRELFGV